MSSPRSAQDRRVLTGLDVLKRRVSGGDTLELPAKARLGLLCNNAVVDGDLRGAPEVLSRLPGLRLRKIFSPQHGFAGEKQDNMVESGHGVHSETGLPIFSLYGEVRQPEEAWLADLDALIIDLPDVGTRVYTFLSTALLCMQVCARLQLPVVVLDRPNPIGGAVEGPVLHPQFSSFVGLLPIPLRHGLTLGESCGFGARALELSVDLRVIAAEGWTRDLLFPQTGLPWIMPSPNLPTWEGALVYPGMVLLEGTNLSEGRGTTRPFELFGAPWLEPARVHRALTEDGRKDTREDGFLLRPIAFQPTFHKFAGQTARGFQIHVLDPRTFLPVSAAMRILAAIRRCHPRDFAFKAPPYEYDTERMPIDLIAGTDRLRQAIEADGEVEELLAAWRDEEEAFRREIGAFLLYREAQ